MRSSSVRRSTSWIARHKEGTPWFCYFNPTRMHVFTHLKPASVGKTGLGLYPDGMVELDGYVGELLKKLDDLKVADNTIVVFTTDNGAEVLSWPDGGATPFRGEKDTNWEGGWRVPCVMRWPGVIEPGDGDQRHLLPAGFHSDFRGRERRARPRRESEEGLQDRRQDLQGPPRRLQPAALPLRKEEKSPRQGFIYWSDDGDCMGMRIGRFKIVFAEQRSKGLDVWREPLSPMRIPKFFDLRADPFERGEESFKFNDWFCENVPLQYLAPPLLMKWLESFKEFPPRQKPASFSIDQVMEKMTERAA